MISDRLANAVVGISALIWTTGQLVDIFNVTDFIVTDAFNGIFMGIAGGALLAKQRNTSGGEHKK